MPALTVKTPAKTILFGEHAVVYGHPAIAVPLNALHLKVSIFPRPDLPAGVITIRNVETGAEQLLTDLDHAHPIRAAIQLIMQRLGIEVFPPADLVISSTIPIASGLGSSAALSVALMRSLSQYVGAYLPDDQINNLAFEIEKIQHGTPSGIDNTVITYNRPVFYIKGKPVEFLEFPNPITLIVADTGIPSLTKEAIRLVKAELDADPSIFQATLNQIGRIAEDARQALLQGNIESVGLLMNENQAALRALGVSSAKLEHLIHTALNQGALGAKLCGGGMGGNMIALVHEQAALNMQQTLLQQGAASAWIATVK